MRKSFIGCFSAMLMLFSTSLSSAGDSTVNPAPEIGGSSKCTVSSNPSQNIGYCINFFGGDYCTGSSSSGTIAPKCDGTVRPL